MEKIVNDLRVVPGNRSFRDAIEALAREHRGGISLKAGGKLSAAASLVSALFKNSSYNYYFVKIVGNGRALAPLGRGGAHRGRYGCANRLRRKFWNLIGRPNRPVVRLRTRRPVCDS